VSNPDKPIENEFLIGGNERRAIVLVDYDPSWPVCFQDERAKLTMALGTEAIGIEHIGSTAVPGLAAKPDVKAPSKLDSRPTVSRSCRPFEPSCSSACRATHTDELTVRPAWVMARGNGTSADF